MSEANMRKTHADSSENGTRNRFGYEERMMRRSNTSRLLTAFLALLYVGSNGFAQQQPSPMNAAVSDAPASTTPPPDETWLPDILKRMPKTPDQPSNLYQKPAAVGDYACPPTTEPYFIPDPLLDPVGYAQPGWFMSAETFILAPHVVKDLVGFPTVGSRGQDTVDLPVRNLNWTAMPRVELGYRLPSGFGGFSVSWQTLSTSGNMQFIGPDGLGSLSSRLAMNVADFDYQSWEFAPSNLWKFRWRVGARLEYIYYDTALSQNPAAAAAGTGILDQHATNMFSGAGPHASLEITRQLGSPEWQFLSRIDFASEFGRIKQNASEIALDPASSSGVSWGESPRSSSQVSPQFNSLFGIDWHPADWPNVDVFMGYQFDYWWNVGRLSLEQGFQRSRGDLIMQGVMFRFQFNY